MRGGIPAAAGLALVLGLFPVGPHPARAQEERVEELREQLVGEAFTIYADTIEYDRDRELYVASGHVRIEQTRERYLLADWMAFSPEERTGVATGNVELVDGADRLRAQFAAVDLDTLEARLTDAELVASDTGYRLNARLLEKTGPDTYHLEEGIITPCPLEPGMVFNLENQFDVWENWPGGTGAAYIESLLMTESGLEVLSELPRNLVAV